MPIEFSTSLELDLVYARWTGTIDFEQFEQNFSSYLNDAHYVPGRPELIDHSGITNFDISSARVRSILWQVNAQLPDVIVQTHTVIYSPDETLFGLGRMYQLLAEVADGIRVEIFREQAEALAALGLSYQTIDSLLAAETFLPACPRTG